MGIKNLKILLQNYCENHVIKKDLKEYKGKILAVDCSIFIYKSLYNNSDILDGMTRNILRFLKNGIIPYFVFDGKPPEEKNILLEERKDKKNHLIEKKNEIEKIIENKKKGEIKMDEIPINDQNNYMTMYIEELEQELVKVNKNIININSEHFHLLYKLLKYFGIPYIIAEGEGETFCAKLYINNKVDGIISEDSDVLPNGGKIFIRGFNPERNYVEEYNLDVILTNLELEYNQFVDLCILCGCDYTTKINGIGPITAYKLIKSYDNIENIIEYIKKTNKYKIPENFEYDNARYLFKKSFEDYNYENINILLNKPNIEKIKELLIENSSSLKEKYIYEIEHYLINYYDNINHNNNNQIQTNLFSYFKTNKK
jgi:flap endonuclease-1